MALYQTKHFLVKTEDPAGGIEEIGQDYQNYYAHDDYNTEGIHLFKEKKTCAKYLNFSSQASTQTSLDQDQEQEQERKN